MPPRPRSLAKEMDHEARVRALLALEIDRVVGDLEARHSLLVELWGRHRERGPLMDTIFVRWTTLSFADLAQLPIDQVVLVDTFYRELDLLRLYFLFTEDMPGHMDEELGRSTRRLRAIADLAIDALGGTPDRVEIDFEDEPPLADRMDVPEATGDSEPATEPD